MPSQRRAQQLWAGLSSALILVVVPVPVWAVELASACCQPTAADGRARSLGRGGTEPLARRWRAIPVARRTGPVPAPWLSISVTVLVHGSCVALNLGVRTDDVLPGGLFHRRQVALVSVRIGAASDFPNFASC